MPVHLSKGAKPVTPSLRMRTAPGSHGLPYAPADEPPVGGVGGYEAQDHADPPQEPVGGPVRVDILLCADRAASTCPAPGNGTPKTRCYAATRVTTGPRV